MQRKIRLSIAGLMVVVLLVSLTLALFRYEVAVASGAVSLVTCGVLALAVVGVFCREKAERAWWLGFALFGWSYMAIAASAPGYPPTRLPSSEFLHLLCDRLRIATPFPWAFLGGMNNAHSLDTLCFEDYERVAHCLSALVFASLGGAIAVPLFGKREIKDLAPAAGRAAEVSPGKPITWTRLAALGSAAFAALATCFLTVGVGAAYLLTWALLGSAALGAVVSTGRRRAACLGAVLFGAGFFVLVYGNSVMGRPARLATNHFLNCFRSVFAPGVSIIPATSPTVAEANGHILEALEQPITLHFRQETPFVEVLDDIKTETRRPDGKKIQFWLDPVSMQEAEKTDQSPVVIDLEGVPLRTALRLILHQLGLSFVVYDGLVWIVVEEDTNSYPWPSYEDSFLLGGHCVLGLVAACFGAALGAFLTRPPAATNRDSLARTRGEFT